MVAIGLAFTLGGCGESAAHKDARETARIDAEAFCSITEGLQTYSDAYARCVKDQTSRNLQDWEAAHPGK